LPQQVTHYLPFVSPAAVLAVLAFLYRRFRKSGDREIEPFGRYLWNGLRFYVGRFLWRQLVAEAALRSYAKVQLRSTGAEMTVPATYPVPLLVDRVYVPLLLQGPLQETVDHHWLLDRGAQRVVVIGDPGSGKSSLVKRVFRDACRRAASSPRRASLPVLIELRTLTPSLQQSNDLSLMDAIERTVANVDIYRSDQAVTRLRTGPGLLILLDGLDEVPIDISLKLQSKIGDLSQKLAETSPNSSIILTARTQYYLTAMQSRLKESFTALTIQPFSQGDVYQFLIRWPYAKGRSLAREATRLFSKIQQLPSLAEMCTNPLALAMYVARDQQTGGSEFVETRTSFYHALMGELLVKRRARSEGSRASGLTRLRDERIAILGRICLDHLLDPDEPANSIPYSRFRAVLHEAMSIVGEEATEVGEEATDREIDELSIQTGLFTVEREAETLRFLHLTLCEFLAGTEIVNGGEEAWRTVLSGLVAVTQPTNANELNQRLVEPIAFATGLAPRKTRESMVRDLVKVGDRALLIRVAMETQAYAEDALEQAIQTECAAISDVIVGGWSSTWFARLGLVVSALRDAEATQSPTTKSRRLPAAADFLRGLIGSNPVAAERLIRPLSRVDPESAIGLANSSTDAQLRRLVADSSDDLGVLIGLVAKGALNDPLWRLEIVRSAFVNARVAHTLASISAAGLISPNLPPWERSAWARCWLVKGSLYAALLALCFVTGPLSDPIANDPDTKLAWRILQTRPPRSRLWSSTTRITLISIPVFVLSTLASVAAIGSGNVLGTTGASVLSALVAGLTAIAIGSTTYSLFRSVSRASTQLVISNVSVQLAAATVSITFGGRSATGAVANSFVKVLVPFGSDPGSYMAVSTPRPDRVFEEILNLQAYPLVDARGLSERYKHQDFLLRLTSGVKRVHLVLLSEVRDARSRDSDGALPANGQG